MKKKILLFLSVISMCLFGLFNSFVYAQEVELPDRYIKLNYVGYNFVEEYEETFEYMAVYTLPYRVPEGTTHRYFLVYPYANFLHSGVNKIENSYMLNLTRRYPDYTEFTFRLRLRKDLVSSRYSGDVTLFFTEHAAIYYKSDYIQPEKVMKNFLLAEPNLENGFEHIVGNERYYMYLDARVYLPDGTTTDLAAMPDVISDRSDLFDGYDFVAISFNLSPRARFWSPSIYPAEPILGLSYIVYDLVAGSTTLYDYMGRVAYHINSIIYIDIPQFILPEIEALDYQLKASYEEGKTEGYRQGREEGIRAGKRQMQEEMQQVIDNLTEYYEQELIKAYNRGKLEGANEDFNIFGYLQALFGEQGLGRLLKLELLPGVSLGAVIMIPLAFWLVSFIMRWFR